MASAPRFLVVDGYHAEGRAELVEAGVSNAGALYAATLAKCCPGAEADVIRPAEDGAALPDGAGLEDYDGVAWTGSSLTAYDDDPRVRVQIDLARACFEAGVPAFGSCWGAQIAVLAAGGEVRANPRGRELGIARKISLTPEGRGHPMYEGKAGTFDAFASHLDEITGLPPGALCLASNAHSRVQAVVVSHRGGQFWAPQYHPELDLHEIARLIIARLDKLVAEGFFADREAGLAYAGRLEALHQDPSRADLAWQLAVDEDLLDEEVRLREVRNWIDRLVRPAMAR